MASKPYSKPTIFKTGIVRGFDEKPEISREGGQFDAGYIKNFAVITKGEALGHEAWVDDEFVSQVGQQLMLAKKGIKSRYTHPNQCGDSFSKGLGRVYFRDSGDGKVRGDLHFWKAAHNTPDGNLAGFLLDMAEDDPEAFGASISFMRDPEAEAEFSAKNPESPDSANVNNYPHVRLGELRFVDIVDEPAANPDGLFHRGGEVASAEAMLEYALGLREDKPSDCDTIFGIESSRLLGFVSNFLSQKGLQVMKLNINEDILGDPKTEELSGHYPDEPKVEEPKAEEPKVKEAEVEEPKAEEPKVEEAEVEEPKAEEVEEPKKDLSKEELSKYIESFGKDQGVDFFLNGVEFGEAQNKFIQFQKDQIEKLQKEVELASISEATPLESNEGENVAPPKGQGFSSKINIV